MREHGMKIPIKADTHMQHIHLDHNAITEFNDYQSSLRMKIMAQVADTTDKAICEAIIRYADEQGVTDLYLIDEEFIKSAIIHEIQRRKGNTE